MKKVIFVCLLTFSVCLSQPANTANPPPTQHETAKAAAAEASAPTVPAVAPSTATVDPKLANDTSHKSNETATKPTNTSTVTAAPEKDDKTNNTTGDKDKTNTTSSTTPKATTTSSTVPPVTTTTTTTTTTTEKPTATTGTPTLQARGFDGASFVGGIILTLGLLAIGFMGFKYYKAQTERNYHTL